MDFLEIVNLVLTVLLGIGLLRLMVSKDDGESSRFRHTMNMADRIKKLEDNARYIAEQPQHTSFYSNSTMSMNYDSLLNAYAMQPNLNEVPINDVVKAIVKHLDMQIEKVAEVTTKTPQEVKVVAKQPSVTITGTNGLTGTTWANPNPETKQKRKYTKRKSK